jgi:spore germination cell wall hydrolase CwlJ-like protein
VLLIPLQLAAVPTPISPGFDLKDLRCLELNIHYEARGESDKGKLAVGMVTLNRAKNKNFPKQICDVVYQKYQFSWTTQFPNHSKTKVDPKITLLAMDLLTNKYKDFTNGALYFHNAEVESFDRKVVAQIGSHTFYR